MKRGPARVQWWLEEQDDYLCFLSFRATEIIREFEKNTSKVDLFQSAVTHMSDNSYAFTSSAPSEFSQMEELIDEEIISVENQGNVVYSVWVSFLEVYNECVYDLLVPPTSDKRIPLKIAQDRGRNYFVKGLKQVHVTSGIEAYKVLLVGKNNLQVASTNLNRSSSRSHCVFSIKLVKRENVENPSHATLSSFSICDLAGAERLEKTGNTGNRMKETQNINTSLHVLVRCFKTMLENQSRPLKPEIVPYRDSKLTQLFHRQLSGKFNEDVIMIVNANPSPKLFEETAFVLKASAIAKQIIKKPLLIKRPRKSLFSTIVFENKNRETIPWECIEENPSKQGSIDLEQLYQDFELEKQKIREECEAQRMEAVTMLDKVIQEMIVEHSERLEETRELYMQERIRREDLYRACIANLRAQIAASDGQSSSQSTSGYGSDFGAELQASQALEQSVQEANKERDELKVEITSLKTKNRELSEKIKTLEKESEKAITLERELRSNQQKTEKLKTLLEEARIDLIESDEDRSLLQDSLADAHSKIADLTEENGELNKMIHCKNQTIESLETEIDKRDKQIDQLYSENESKDYTIESLQERIDRLQMDNETVVITESRRLNTVETQRDNEIKKNKELEEKIKKITAANEENVAKYQKTIEELKEALEKQGIKQRVKRATKKNLSQFSDSENQEVEPVKEPRTEPKTRLRTRNQIKVMHKSPNKRRSKSADSRMPLKVQCPNNLSVNRTPSPGSLYCESEKRLTKSCRKMLYRASRDFLNEDTEPINFNPLVLMSPKSELKNVKRRLRNQQK